MATSVSLDDYRALHLERVAALPYAMGLQSFSDRYGEDGYVSCVRVTGSDSIEIDVHNGRDIGGNVGYNTYIVTFNRNKVENVDKSPNKWD